MREGETEVMKRHGGGASLLLPYSAALSGRRWRKERGDGRGGEDRSRGGGGGGLESKENRGKKLWKGKGKEISKPG